MEAQERVVIPNIPRRTREDTLVRLRVEATEATENIDRFVRRGKPDMAQYYAGRRDGLLRAITMLESE